jgi:hypothetical protein
LLLVRIVAHLFIFFSLLCFKVLLAEPTGAALESALSEAHRRARGPDRRWHFHRRVRAMYRWSDVAERTERVYHRVKAAPARSTSERLAKYARAGPILGVLGCVVLALELVVLALLECFAPRAEIEIAPDVPNACSAAGGGRASATVADGGGGDDSGDDSGDGGGATSTST